MLGAHNAFFKQNQVISTACGNVYKILPGQEHGGLFYKPCNAHPDDGSVFKEHAIEQSAWTGQTCSLGCRKGRYLQG